MTFSPLVGAIIIMFAPKNNEKLIKILALIFSGISLFLAVIIYMNFDKSGAGLQFVEKAKWIESIGASYYLGIDGVSFPLVILTPFITFIAIIASWKVSLRPKEYFGFMLLLEVGMIGVFLALDFILFYIFWELVLLPMYFLIGIWGGPRREYAAIKFFLYTLFGSVFMLLGILTLYFYSGQNTFDMVRLASANLPYSIQKTAFILLFFGFAVKVPIVPFHTWLPDAHVEAPTAVSVLLAGVLLKMGTYAFVRIGLGIVPDGMKTYAFTLAVLAVISILYGGLNAMVQKDLKKLVAYSSVSHMGYVMLGIASFNTVGVSGAILQMFNHGTITGMLFLLVGLVYERTHTRQIDELGGLFTVIPIIAGIFSFASFASLGLPSLSGFMGEFLILTGAFFEFKLLTALAGLGIVITAGYMLWTVQRISMGEPKKFTELPDASPRELSTLIPLMIVIIIIGLYPAPLLKAIDPTVVNMISKIGGI
jgi:NADH-quinone oxidoreductase subunit M